MKTNLLLKNLIDILFILMITGLAGFLIILPFGIFNTSIGNVSLNGYEDVFSLSMLYWLAVAISIISYILMLVALYYLKRTARHFLDNNLLKKQVIENLNKSGLYLVITAIAVTVSYLLTWIASFNGTTISVQYGNNIFVPVFITIVGLFFKLISNTLKSVRLMKAEHDLTI